MARRRCRCTRVVNTARPIRSTASLPGLLLETSPTDHRRLGARYEEIAKRLRDGGWDARVTINDSERRSAVTEVVVRLLDQTGCTAVDALTPLLAMLVRRSLLRRQGDRGRVVIYRATGEVLRIVEISEMIAEERTSRA
jgi:hypothetical protein